jgi:hypothetical protein
VDEVAPHLLCESGPDGMAESWPVGGEKRMRVGSAQSAVRHTVDVAASLLCHLSVSKELVLPALTSHITCLSHCPQTATSILLAWPNPWYELSEGP